MISKDGIDMGQTGYGLLVEYTKVEILRVREFIKQAQLMESALVKSLESLQKVDVANIGIISTGNTDDLNEKLQSLKEPGYPYKGTKEDKVIFLLKKINKTSKIAELTDEIMRIEGATDGRIVSKSLNYKMNQMTADGKLVIARWNKSKQIFYALPEFFTNLEKGNVVMKDEHYPTSEAWGKTPESERNFVKAKWVMFIK